MKKSLIFISMKYILLIILTIFTHCFSNAQSSYFPPKSGDEWQTVSAEDLGWCSSSVSDLFQFLDDNSTKSFLLLKDGKIVLEKYFGSFTQDSSWVWYSAGKSLTSILIGIAQQKGYLDINEPTSKYLGTGWTTMSSDQENSIKVRHQLSMSTGLNEEDFYCTDPECLHYEADPNTRWYYHNAPYSLLRKVVENSTEKGLNVFTYQEISSKIGMKGVWVPAGYNSFFLSTARDMARYGLLIMNHGIWNNDSILKDAGYYEAMTHSSQEMNPSYGYLWWLNGKQSFIPPGIQTSFPGPIAPDAPEDLILAAGAQGQFIAISPAEKLIMIRQGTLSNDALVPIDLHNEIWKKLNTLMCPTSSIQLEESSFKVFPNPASDFLSINQTQAKRFVLELFFSNGRPAGKWINQNRIAIQNLPSGIYFLKIQTEKEVAFQKLLIRK